MAIRRTLALSVIWTWAVAASAGELRLNQIQMIGTHNSYHVAPSPNVMELIAKGGQDRARSIDYTHLPLAEQFSGQGIRQIELDVFADPKGGLFAEPTMRKILKGLGKDPGPDPNQDGVLQKPGLKVLHVPDVDFRTTVPTFKDALTQVRKWSGSHPSHVPILILVELKDESVPSLPTRLVPFDKAGLDAVDAEIQAVFPKSHLLTPDDVRGRHDSLPEAIHKTGWPTLEAARGKVMFALDNEGRIRDLYLEGHPALRDRLMFATAPAPEHPAAAWFKINDPVRDFDRIQDMVRRGFLVRTRADADTVEARKNDGARREKAMTSGAQFLSTDFPVQRKDISTYRVRFAGDSVARKNPVNVQGDAPDGDLEATTGKNR